MPTTPLASAPADRARWREQAQRDGYLYVPRLLAPEALAPLRSLIDAALRARGWLVPREVAARDAAAGNVAARDATASDAAAGSSRLLVGATDPALRLGRPDDARWFAFLADVLQSEACHALAESPALVQAVAAMLGVDPFVDAPRVDLHAARHAARHAAPHVEAHVGTVCRIVSPGDPMLSTPPHQDAAYVNDAAQVWTAWIPLVPCPRELGPLAVWAGSHRGGLREHGPVAPGGTDAGKAIVPDDVVWTTGDLELGDVVFFSSLTVHRALDNVTADRLRVSIDYRYRAPHNA